jgi:hypothetical protein
MSDREELLRELERRDEEILRLRELLLARDVELGEALGRERELEELMRVVMVYAGKVQSRAPVLLKLARAGFRLARRIVRGLRSLRGRVGG